MKIFSLFIFLLCSTMILAQRSPFVRVYDLAGKKIGRGHIFSSSDTSLELGRGGSMLRYIPLNQIGTIKTKHSGASNILIGGIIGAVSLGAIGAASAEPDADFLDYSAGEGAAIGALAGLVAGVAVGALTILLKHSRTFAVNGDASTWKSVRLLLLSKK